MACKQIQLKLTHVYTSMYLVRVKNASAGNSGWSFSEAPPLITNLRPCSGWTAAIEDLGLIEAWSLSVLRCLQTRWSGPTGHLLPGGTCGLDLSLRRLWYTQGIMHVGTKTVID